MADETGGTVSTDTGIAAPDASPGVESANQVETTSQADAWSIDFDEGQESQPPADEGNQNTQEATSEDEDRSPQAEAEEADPSTGAEEEEPSGADEFDKITDPKREDFQAIRENRKTVVARLNELEPVVERVERLGGLGVIEAISPLFEPFASDDDPRIGEAGLSVVEALSQRDPRIGWAITNGVFEKHKEALKSWALGEEGITPELIQEYRDFQSAGGAAAYRTQAFPAPDQEGIVTLPDGTELDINDPGHKVAYSLAKESWERDAKERDRVARDEHQRVEAARRAEVERQQSAIGEWLGERDQVFEQAVSKLAINVGSEKENASARQMILGMARYMADEDSAFMDDVREGRRLAASGGAAAKDKADAIDRKGLGLLSQSAKLVTGLYAELNQLRRQVQSGQPKNTVPNPDTPPKTLPSRDALPSRPETETAVDDIWAEVGR